MTAETFARIATSYTRFRPRYPPQLFAALVALAPHRRSAWDCATGSGQAASELVNHVDRVIATDKSPELLAQAVPHPRIEYRQADALASSLDDHSVPLVTVANAMHWFAGEAFEREVRRVLEPGGVIAAFGLALETIGAELDPLLRQLHDEIVAPYWLEPNWIVHEGYRRLRFDFAPIDPPTIVMETQPSADELLGYFRTWSASVKYQEARGVDPVSLIEPALRARWGPAERRTVRWRLGLRVGRV